MDLDELRTVRRTERQKDSLQHLRDSFYEDVAAYLADLEARRDQAAAEAEDPFASQDVRKLTDKIETAEEVSEAIYERRVGKIVKQASFAAADMSADREGLTEQEQALFEDLVERIKQNKTTVLDILAGEGDAAGAATETDATRSVAADVPDPVSTGARESERSSAVDSSPPESQPRQQGDSPSTDDHSSSTRDTETPEDVPESGANAGMLADAMGGTNATEPVASKSGATGPDTGESTPEESPPPAETADDPGAQPPGASAAVETGNPSTATTEDAGAGAEGSADAGAEGSADADAEGSVDADAEDSVDADVGTVVGESPDVTADGDAPGDDQVSADPTPTTDGGAAQLERTTVRLTRDVGSILGVDEREYELEREDVVTLPATNAEPLVERDAAERLE
jgi:DNA replication factor GINS